jgi:hypothetical protein
MGFKDMLESLNNDNNSIPDEQILEWLNMSPADRAVVIKEAKEKGETEHILSLNETANLWKDVIAWCTASDELREQALEASKEDKELHETLLFLEKETREDALKALKGLDTGIDTYQDKLKSIESKNIPLISKGAAKLRSNAGDAEVATKAGRVAKFLGASDENTLKAMKVAGTASQKSKEIAGEAGGAVKKLASEHGGKMAAAAAAGLGALGLVKALRRKKAKEATA